MRHLSLSTMRTLALALSLLLLAGCAGFTSATEADSPLVPTAPVATPTTVPAMTKGTSLIHVLGVEGCDPQAYKESRNTVRKGSVQIAVVCK